MNMGAHGLQQSCVRAAPMVRDALFGLLMWAALHPGALQPSHLFHSSAAHAAGLGAAHAHAHAVAAPLPQPAQASFAGVVPSADARTIADWVARVNDSRGLPFVVIDKRAAKLYLFNPQAQLQAHAAVLLGSAAGDLSVPGIGERPIELVKPEERTTPAGRFLGERGRNARGEDVVWVDYDAAVSMHRVVTSNPAEGRLARLASSTADDNRISYGCINVPLAFYEAHIRPTFAAGHAVIYVLPDSGSLGQFFNL